MLEERRPRTQSKEKDWADRGSPTSQANRQLGSAKASLASMILLVFGNDNALNLSDERKYCGNLWHAFAQIRHQDRGLHSVFLAMLVSSVSIAIIYCPAKRALATGSSNEQTPYFWGPEKGPFQRSREGGQARLAMLNMVYLPRVCDLCKHEHESERAAAIGLSAIHNARLPAKTRARP